MTTPSNSFSAGYSGCTIVSNTTAKTGQFRGFVVNSAAVVSACLDESGASLMTSLGLSGVTINQGMFIAVADGKYISSITLTSGSIILYND